MESQFERAVPVRWKQGRAALESRFQDHGQLHAAASVLLKASSRISPRHAKLLVKLSHYF